MARLLENVYTLRKNTLPAEFWLQLDNTARENKNQKMLRFSILMTLRGVFKTISLCFLRKGHTHEDIDGPFSQTSPVVSKADFQSAMELEESLNYNMRQLRVDGEAREHSLAYIMDETTDWDLYAKGIVDTEFVWGLGGPNAPHMFQFVCRKYLPVGSFVCPIEDREDLSNSHEGDVFMMTKQYLHDDDWAQVVFVCGADKAVHPMPMPTSVAANKVVSRKDAAEILKQCQLAAEQGFLSSEGRSFLENYAHGTLRKRPRPDEYSFLRHRFEAVANRAKRQRTIVYDGISMGVNQVRVKPGPLRADDRGDDVAAYLAPLADDVGDDG